jgi:hypothetical protein
VLVGREPRGLNGYAAIRTRAIPIHGFAVHQKATTGNVSFASEPHGYGPSGEAPTPAVRRRIDLERYSGHRAPDSCLEGAQRCTKDVVGVVPRLDPQEAIETGAAFGRIPRDRLVGRYCWTPTWLWEPADPQPTAR